MFVCLIARLHPIYNFSDAVSFYNFSNVKKYMYSIIFIIHYISKL